MQCTHPSHAFNPTGLLILTKYRLLEYGRGLYHSSNQFDELGREKSSEIVQRGYLDVKVVKSRKNNFLIIVTSVPVEGFYWLPYIERSGSCANFSQF
jgi:hypothetical protein